MTASGRNSDEFCVSVVVPMYNEEDVIDSFFSRIIPVLERSAPSFEIVCVSDGSMDRTLQKLQAAQSRYRSVRIINLARNFGKEAALTAGLDACCGDAVIPIDADLQDPPELIFDFVTRWRNGADVVVGVRQDRSSDSFGKRMTAYWFYTLFNKFADIAITPNAGDFRLMDRQVVEVLRRLPERTRFMKGLFAWVGFKQEQVFFKRERRAAGAGKWRAWRLLNFALEGIFSFTTLPLRMWTYIGISVAGASFLYMTVLIGRTLLFGVDVPGYASLAVLLLFSLSLNMISVGILGEYIGRIYAEVKGRPLYVVESKFGFDVSETSDTAAMANALASVASSAHRSRP